MTYSKWMNGNEFLSHHVRAGDTRCQDEMLKQLPSVAEQTEYTTLKTELLPRMHTLCLKTTSASVRVNSLTCMARVAARLDEDEAGKMLQTAGKVHPLPSTTKFCYLDEFISMPAADAFCRLCCRCPAADGFCTSALSQLLRADAFEPASKPAAALRRTLALVWHCKPVPCAAML